jgi:hypothetical protein
MPAAHYDLIIEQGATFEKTVTWKDSDGNAVDLTGYTARMQIRRSKSSTTTILSITTDDAITLGGTAGTVAISIPAATTATFTFRRAVYDLELVSGGGVVYRLLEGVVGLSKEVTR